jgi:biopolymer transport protein ExbD
MKKHSMPEMKEGGVNVTPLIDIVMCLIVFFMLMTKLGVARGIDKDIKLPSAILGKQIADMGDTLSVNIHYMPSADSPQVTIMVDGQNKEVKILEGRDHPLQRVLEAFKLAHMDKETKTSKAKIIIRGDQNLTYGQLEKVLMTISDAGISDTAYETKPAAADAVAAQ